MEPVGFYKKNILSLDLHQLQKTFTLRANCNILAMASELSDGHNAYFPQEGAQQQPAGKNKRVNGDTNTNGTFFLHADKIRLIKIIYRYSSWDERWSNR